MDAFHIQDSFPTIITPQSKYLNLQDFLQDLPKYQAPLRDLLLKKGAFIFRGFPIKTADDFEKVIKALNLGELVDYIGGDSPRNKVTGKVYTSTEAPPSFHIPFHQELSFMKNFPKYIYFFCEVAPVHHGETIIADARKVYAALDQKIIKRFEEKNITYISRYFHESKFMTLLNKIARSHRSWTEVFESENKHKVEQFCGENEIQYSWTKNDWIELKQTRPAIIKHPITQETVWFNQAHLFDFNPKFLGMMNYLFISLIYMNPDKRLHEVTFGDGEKIPRNELYHILDVLEANTVKEPWREGDVMVLDNILTMHGRAPYTGKRRILTALTK